MVAAIHKAGQTTYERDLRTQQIVVLEYSMVQYLVPGSNQPSFSSSLPHVSWENMTGKNRITLALPTHLNKLGEVLLEHARQLRPGSVVALLVAPRFAGVQHLGRDAGNLSRNLEPENLQTPPRRTTEMEITLKITFKTLGK